MWSPPPGWLFFHTVARPVQSGVPRSKTLFHGVSLMWWSWYSIVASWLNGITMYTNQCSQHNLVCNCVLILCELFDWRWSKLLLRCTWIALPLQRSHCSWTCNEPIFFSQCVCFILPIRIFKCSWDFCSNNISKPFISSVSCFLHVLS